MNALMGRAGVCRLAGDFTPIPGPHGIHTPGGLPAIQFFLAAAANANFSPENQGRGKGQQRPLRSTTPPLGGSDDRAGAPDERISRGRAFGRRNPCAEPSIGSASSACL